MKIYLKLPGGELRFEQEPASKERFRAVCALLGFALYVRLTKVIVSMQDFYAFLWYLLLSAGAVAGGIAALHKTKD